MPRRAVPAGQNREIAPPAMRPQPLTCGPVDEPSKSRARAAPYSGTMAATGFAADTACARRRHHARIPIECAPTLRTSKARSNMTKTSNSHYARPPAPPTPAEAPAKAPVKTAARKAKKTKSKVAKSKPGRALSGSRVLKGKSKPAKKK